MKYKDITSEYISSLFIEEPYQWGLRGDPYLWDEMRLNSKNKKILDNENLMKDYLYELFKNLTDFEITINKNIHIKRYFYGSGMSGGCVCSNWWIEYGIPFILERYKKNKLANEGIKYEIKEIYCKSEFFKGSRNSIEQAIERLFMFKEINLVNLIELLSIDENIKKISKKTREKIVEKINNDKYNKSECNKIFELLNV